jgi:hypothetical protein
MSKPSSEVVLPVEAPAPKPVAVSSLLPLPVWIIAAVMILAGGIVVGTRTSHLESSTYEAISNCNAAGKKSQSKTEINGLSEEFGLVSFQRTVSDVTQYLTLCDTEPNIALAVFRRALTKGNVSAKVIALHSAIFLAPHLESSDFQLLLTNLDDKAPDVSHVAQRAISDLTLLKRADNPGVYEALPPELPPSASGSSHKIQTRKESIDGQAYLEIRWTDAELVQAWWKANAASGAWDTKLHRFVVP